MGILATNRLISQCFLTKQTSSFQPCVAFHVETSHLFCRARQMIDSYMKCIAGLK